MILFTIGHSNHRLERLIELLRQYQVSLVVDIRSVPASRYNPQFNQKSLRHTLYENGIEYIYMGDQLGGRPDDPTLYQRPVNPKDNQIHYELDYKKIIQRDWFFVGIQNLINFTREKVAAILCSEEDPYHCHRHFIVSRYIFEEIPDVTIKHIRRSGAVFTLEGTQQELFTIEEEE